MYIERFRLTGRVALVTGGAGGIGLCTAQALAEAGAQVTIADLEQVAIEEAKSKLNGLGYDMEGVVMDVTNSEQVTHVADRMARDLGRIDILVNNAGIARSQTAAEDVSDEHWLNVLDVNLNGTFWCARAFGRHMLKQGSGTIVNVGSMSGFIVNRPQAQSYYNASKAAVHHLTKSLAAEWAFRGVRVNDGRAHLHCHFDQRLRGQNERNVSPLDRWHSYGASRPTGRSRFRYSVLGIRCLQPHDWQRRFGGRRLQLLVKRASCDIVVHARATQTSKK